MQKISLFSILRAMNFFIKLCAIKTNRVLKYPKKLLANKAAYNEGCRLEKQKKIDSKNNIRIDLPIATCITVAGGSGPYKRPKAESAHKVLLSIDGS